MCGVIGLVFEKPTTEIIPTLLENIKAIDDRGYDNCGVVIQNSEGAICYKTVGKAYELAAQIKASEKTLLATTGLAHTRWATHGNKEDVRNAHPHTDTSQNIWIVHNGTLENYKELRRALLSEAEINKRFTCEFVTDDNDSEVIAHLVALNKLKSGDFLEAVKMTCAELQGAFALLAIDNREPDRVICAKNLSTTMVMINETEFKGFASDLTAFSEMMNEVDTQRVPDNKIVDYRDGKFYLHSLDGEYEGAANSFTRVSLEELKAYKGNYNTFMLKEMMEQAEKVAQAMSGRILTERGLVELGGIKEYNELLKPINKIILIATGSSYYAAQIGAMYFRKFTGIEAQAVLSGEFEWSYPLITPKTAIIGVSQSGETADTVKALNYAKSKSPGVVLGIVNNIMSQIGDLTTAGVTMKAGKEKGVAATKTVTNQILAMLMLALYWSQLKRCDLIQHSVYLDELSRLPDLISRMLANRPKIQRLASEYAGLEHIMLFGKGFDYPIALEGALKIKEICRVPAMGHSTEDAKHGPIAMANSNLLCIALAPDNEHYLQTEHVVSEFVGNNAKMIVIVSEGNYRLDLADEIIFIPKVSSWLTPFMNLLFMQLFSYYLCLEKGFNADKPANLAKAVTV